MKVLLYTEKKDYVSIIKILCSELNRNIEVETITDCQLVNIATSHPKSILVLDDRMYKKLNKDCLEVLIKSKMEVVILLPKFINIKRYLNLNVVDYFMTPMNWENLNSRILKIYKNHMTLDLISPDIKKKKLLVKGKSEVYMISEEEILFFEKDQKTVKIHTKNHIYTCHESLKELMHHLSESFFRVHTSYIVNFNNATIISSDHNRKYQIQFDDYIYEAKMSRNKADELLKDTVNHYRLSYIME